MSANFDAKQQAVELIKEAVKAGVFAPLETWSLRPEAQGADVGKAIGAAVEALRKKLEAL